jgi:hypothetical protein
MKVLGLEGRPFNFAVHKITTVAPIDTPMSDGHYTEAMRLGMVTLSRLAPGFASLAELDASYSAGQRFDAFRVSEAMRVAGCEVKA